MMAKNLYPSIFLASQNQYVQNEVVISLPVQITFYNYLYS